MKVSYKVSNMNNLRLIECLDVLAAVMTEDHVAGPAPQPASYVDWVMRMRSTITLMPDSDEGATSRRRIHAALVCGDDHTPLERAWTRYREDPALRALLDEIEALTSDPMYSCPAVGASRSPPARQRPGAGARSVAGRTTGLSAETALIRRRLRLRRRHFAHAPRAFQAICVRLVPRNFLQAEPWAGERRMALRGARSVTTALSSIAFPDTVTGRTS